MLNSKAVDQLLLAGVHALPLDHRTTLLNGVDGQWVAHVIQQNYAPSSNQLSAADALPAGEIALYVVPRALPRTIESVRRHSKVWLVTEDGTTILAGAASHPPQPTKRPRGRVPWGRYALMRTLLRTTELRTQAQLAAESGITQGTASPALAMIPGIEGVANKGWRVTDPSGLWDTFMREYPGPRGVRTHWYFRGTLLQLSERLYDHAVLSADGAADVIAPWRAPVRSVAYCREVVDMESLGFSPSTLDEANLELVFPEDQTIFATARAWESVVVDPVLAAWDVLEVGGNDAAGAAEAIRNHILNGLEA